MGGQLGCSYQCGAHLPRRLMAEHEHDMCPQRPMDVKLDSFMKRMEERHEREMTKMETILIKLYRGNNNEFIHDEKHHDYLEWYCRIPPFIQNLGWSHAHCQQLDLHTIQVASMRQHVSWLVDTASRNSSERSEMHYEAYLEVMDSLVSTK